ncbi:phosphate import ATP-binding protein PstB 3 [Shewanella sp. NFH-SH190041]|uniref:phosphate ABC transporter ATP-binding protein n=1 Tax=Shewanella sp. NFH-SH190041 TaxID=2950245 RepID=UPI0021C2AC15|nr:ATP-binding cassette domain-containing protein [Shewanella sp. NFH-SH190041]BDM64192.1 phosphate import ATP-binding protein PstB 3 [Shewanella sp. NFH-SH190041]
MIAGEIGQISHLHLSYHGEAALTDINLSLQRHQIHVLSGSSGSGKTSLLRCLNRLNDCYPYCQTRGDIQLTLAGENVAVNQLSHHQLAYLRQKVGMVFQHPQLLPGSIADNIMLPLKVVAGMGKAQALIQLQSALEQAALWQEVCQRLDKPAQMLSGGQQQRLCLARALALSPEILLLDEPTASLDPDTTAIIEDLLLSLRRRYTIVMVSHSVAQSKKLADLHFHFEQGRLVD